MLDDFARYAVYWVPPNSDELARFGTSWMGWCAELGEHLPRSADAGHLEEVCQVTRDVARHGFHGVIKAPFRLRQGHSPWAVERALQGVTESLVYLEMPCLKLAVIDGRVALVPARADAELAATVARVESALHPLAESESEPANTNETRAAAGQLRQLPPAEMHRFHLPLTDRIDLGTAFKIAEDLHPWLERLLERPRRLADLALMGDPGGGRPLRLLHRFELRDVPLNPGSAAMPCWGRRTLVGDIAV